MRFPVSGGPPQVVLNVRGYPTYPSFDFCGITGHPDFRCASPPATSCILSEVYQNQLVFSTFDPVEGRKGELTRIDMGPEDAFFWDLSPDGSRIAFGKMDKLSGRISILQLGSGTTQEISVRGWSQSFLPGLVGGWKELVCYTHVDQRELASTRRLQWGGTIAARGDWVACEASTISRRPIPGIWRSVFKQQRMDD